nr:unnamed protein product [Callosobruchus chinensis]
MIPILVTPPSVSYKNGVQSPKLTYMEDKENMTEIFKSPYNSMFQLNMSVENDQNEKRGTYVVKKLVIDDTVFIAEKIVSNLQNSTIKVRRAYSTARRLYAAQRKPIDSVFSGNTSGVSFSGRFKENITPYKTFNMDDSSNVSSATYTKHMLKPQVWALVERSLKI